MSNRLGGRMFGNLGQNSLLFNLLRQPVLKPKVGNRTGCFRRSLPRQNPLSFLICTDQYITEIGRKENTIDYALVLVLEHLI